MKLGFSIFLALLFGSLNIATAQESETQYDDNYDPFADYSEFVEAEAEEADINFFKNGRMLNVGAFLGYHSFTGNMADYHSRDPMFGLFGTYFYSLRFALQAEFSTTTHDLSIPDGSTTLNSQVRLTTFGVHAKHFFNTQNMTRSFSELNPYVLAGFSQIFRNTSNTNSVLQGSDGALAYDFGFGMEYIFNHKKNSVGFMLMYQYADFPNESTQVPSAEVPGDSTGVTLSGDIIYGIISVGINY